MVYLGTIKLVLVSLLCAKASAELYLNPSENQWTRVGSNITLFCKSSEQISKCSWETAYGTLYQFSTGKESKAESGRLQYYLTEDEKECGLVIENVNQKDVGAWSCHITTIASDLGIVAGKGQTSLTIASRPNSIHLDEPYNHGTVNVSLNRAYQSLNSRKPISCRVSNADPKPTFNWYIGETMLPAKESETKDVKDDNNTWVQTLYYTPEVSHDNKTLRCVVDHVGLEETDKREASVTLRFTAQDKKIFKETIIAEQDRTATVCAVATVILVFLACISILVCYNKRLLCFKAVRRQTSELGDDSPKKEIIKPSEFTAVELTSIDGETNEKVKESETPASETNSTNSEEDAEERDEKKNLSERVASFFRLKRKESLNQCQDNVETGLNSSKCSTNGKSNGIKDNTDAEDEKKDDEKPEVDTDTPHETPIRFSKFLNIFKRSGQKTMERMEEIDRETEQNAEDAEKSTEKIQQNGTQGHVEHIGSCQIKSDDVEYEPETKPTENIGASNDIELEEGESSPKLSSSPKNTAV